MAWRIVGFILPAMLLAVAGYEVSGWALAGVGWILGNILWVAVDTIFAARTVAWLRSPELREVPKVGGTWLALVDKVRRIVRSLERQTEDRERRLSEFLAAIQASPYGVVLLDQALRIEWCNQIAAQHFGFDAQRDVQQHIGNLVREPVFAAYMAAGDFSQALAMPGRVSLVSHPMTLSIQLHTYGDQRTLLLSNDVTAREQAEAMRRDFVANVSHEIRTPLTVLSGFVETLQTLALNESDRKRYLALMAQQSHRMQSLVADLLTLSKLEGSPLPSAAGWITSDALMAQCEQEARAFSAVLKDVGPKLEFLQDAQFMVACSNTELLSACSNLVINAIRYTPASGAVKVRCAPMPDGGAEISVEDSGAGIAAEHLPRLTERFYRVDRSRSRDTGGTGLGLAIVKHVVQRHGGVLDIQSTVGKGSRFAIQLPPSRVAEIQRLALAA